MLRFTLVTAIAAFLLASSAAKAAQSGDELYSNCQSKNTALIGVCAGYIVGVANTILQQGGKLGIFISCQPLGVTHQQLTGVVKNWLKKNQISAIFLRLVLSL